VLHPAGLTAISLRISCAASGIPRMSGTRSRRASLEPEPDMSHTFARTPTIPSRSQRKINECARNGESVCLSWRQMFTLYNLFERAMLACRSYLTSSSSPPIRRDIIIASDQNNYATNKIRCRYSFVRRRYSSHVTTP
jgi:hypothetical protein